MSEGLSDSIITLIGVVIAVVIGGIVLAFFAHTILPEFPSGESEPFNFMVPALQLLDSVYHQIIP